VVIAKPVIRGISNVLGDSLFLRLIEGRGGRKGRMGGGRRGGGSVVW